MGAHRPAIAVPPPAVTPPLAPARDGGHGHLWVAADGTGLHAPLGELARDGDTGRVCCHLCGRWFTLLGAHVRVHGHTPDTYRLMVGLCRTRALAATALSERLSGRQRSQYAGSVEVRERLAAGQQLARSGQLGRRAAESRTRSADEPLERARGRTQQLAAGRVTRRQEQDQRLAQRLTDLAAEDLPGYLRAAYAAGASLQSLAEATGLGRQRLRQALHAAGIQVRPTGINTAAGRRSRVGTANDRAAQRLGVDDLHTWLRDRRAEGWSLQRLAGAVGHSSHWVRWRLAEADGAPAPETDRSAAPAVAP